MSSNSSAILGNPPNNEDDFFIVRGIFRSVGLFSANASRGWITVPKEPAGYVYETKQPGIIAGMVIVMLLISVVTATRLALRYYSTKMVFGSDDWVILAAAVSVPNTCCPLCRVVGRGRYALCMFICPANATILCMPEMDKVVSGLGFGNNSQETRLTSSNPQSIAVTYPILQILMVVQGGAGHHVWEVTYAQYNVYAYYGRVCQIIFYIAGKQLPDTI